MTNLLFSFSSIEKTIFDLIPLFSIGFLNEKLANFGPIPINSNISELKLR